MSDRDELRRMWDGVPLPLRVVHHTDAPEPMACIHDVYDRPLTWDTETCERIVAACNAVPTLLAEAEQAERERTETLIDCTNLELGLFYCREAIKRVAEYARQAYKERDELRGIIHQSCEECTTEGCPHCKLLGSMMGTHDGIRRMTIEDSVRQHNDYLVAKCERAERERDEALATVATLREELECHTGCGLDFGADCDECGYHQNDRCVAHQVAHDARATLANLPAAVAVYQEQRQREREALAWYGDEANWQGRYIEQGAPHPLLNITSWASQDGGQRAREALGGSDE